MESILKELQRVGVSYSLQTDMILEGNVARDVVIGFRVYTMGPEVVNLLEPLVEPGKVYRFMINDVVSGYYLHLNKEDPLWKSYNASYLKVHQ